MVKEINSFTYIDNADSVPSIKFRLFSNLNFIKYGFSTRLSGVSKGVFSSMNLGFNRGDERENVMANYRLFCDSIGIDYKKLVFPDQVHSSNVLKAGKSDCGKGIMTDRDYSEIDAIITNEPGVPIIIFASDCVPIFIVDPKQMAVALIHAGWRGSACKSPRSTVLAMQKEFNSKPEDLLAVIGPSAGVCCYEVGIDLREKFLVEYKDNTDEIFTPSVNKDKLMLDLWKANRITMEELGIKSENIQTCGVCTMCNSNLLFSHRVTNGKRGSNAGIIMIDG